MRQSEPWSIGVYLSETRPFAKVKEKRGVKVHRRYLPRPSFQCAAF
jgi:hypothetical protein